MLNHCFKAGSFVLAVIFSIVGSGFISPTFAQQRAYFVVDIDSRAWTQLDYVALDINNNGDILGSSFIVRSNGVGRIDLEIPGADFLRPSAINDSRQVAGLSQTTAGAFRGFITGPEGMGTKYLDSLGGDYSDPWDINDAGQVVGISHTADGLTRAFITGADGVGMRDLGTLPGHSYAEAINNAGQVTGHSSGGAFITGPDGIGIRELGTLPGDEASFPFAINDAGQVTGQSRRSDGKYHAFITGPDGVGMTQLEALPTGGMPFVYDINNAGQVAGAFIIFGPGGGEQAFVTGPNGGGTINLNALIELPGGYNLERALDINDQGQVLVIGIVPEPETYVMLLAGLGLIGFMARRRKPEVQS